MEPAAKRAEKLVMIGLRPEEDAWVRMLVGLLRNPDPVVGELTRQAMIYLADAAGKRDVPALARP
jgi:hypothetical protein